MIKLAIVSPCYNEESIIADSSKQLIMCLDFLKNANKIPKITPKAVTTEAVVIMISTT